MAKVNLLIVGAQKAGTTALASFLSEHPDVCMAPQKEVHLFDAPDFQDSAGFCDARYAEVFKECRGQRWTCDATPIYMYAPDIAPRIRRYNAHMRLIALLRNPVERALSHYAMERARQVERLPLAAALAAEPVRLWRHRHDLSWSSALRAHSYVDRGYYSRQIAHLLRYFPREQLLILRTDDLLRDHAGTLRRVYDFLEIDVPATLPEARQVRPSLGHDPVERSDSLGRLCTPSVPVRAALRYVFKPELRRLERLLGWQLNDWR